MISVTAAISAALAWVSAHQAILIPIGSLIVTDLINSAIKWSPTELSALGLLKQLLDRASVHTNVDSPGTLKWPGTRSPAPLTISSMLATPQPPPAGGSTPIGKIGAVLLFVGLAHLTACASITWSTPVLMAGPAVGFEEVSKAHPAAAAAAGFQLTAGLGQFDFQGHEFDLLDVGVLALGGVILPGAGPIGALQLGGEVGTLAGIVAVAVLATPYAVDGSGFAQGGSPGVTYAAMINVAAITAYLTSSSPLLGAEERLPRGGL